MVDGRGDCSVVAGNNDGVFVMLCSQWYGSLNVKKGSSCLEWQKYEAV